MKRWSGRGRTCCKSIDEWPSWPTGWGSIRSGWTSTTSVLKVGQAYQEAMEQSLGRKVQNVGARAAIMRDTFCARTEQEALDIAGDLMMATFNFSNWRGPSIYLDPGETLSPEEEARLKEKLPYDFVRDRCVWFGGPERIYDKIVELKEETDVDNVHFKSSWIGLDFDSFYGSIEMIGKEVLPALRTKYGASSPMIS